ncbi:CaiB/BaiF CoA transferase family protein [Dactylosporangium matsuzakiense]|uniref:Succinyl-CoA--D-citramalate CoA-transferase n=1 Tax=Dactylosporangium matsuzakiense TaxID=53360 RepID=A0A9W6KE99_9ACTN|nr:CoA transferase [Dactylosporangium matsuzakiense]UWZ47106.1 CoA transferase [Dactylosporangium matsuzakiense]GLK98459.1 succinyl-CoA--D-citramalate CoA-transferase [Dactylosporangium matsuzakiense]
MTSQTFAGPLSGVRVLELGSFIAGPFAGQLLADYGAEVIKLEPPGGGDPMRRWGVVKDGQSLWWPAIARNKRSVALDLRHADGQAVARALAAECDVVLENFRPGTLDKWGLGYEALAAVNPGIIVVHVSGLGQTGPRSREAGFGSIGEAMGGIRFTTGDPGSRPARTGVSIGDSLAALFAVVGTSTALVERARSGRGQEVDVAIYEAVAALMESTMVDYERAGVLRTRTGSVLPGVAPSNVYTSADGAEIAIAGNADAVYRRLCQAMGRPELADDPRFDNHEARGRNSAILDDEIERWTGSRTAEELLGVLAEHGVPAGRIYTAPDMLTDLHYAARDMVLRPKTADGEAGPMAGIVPKFSRTPGEVSSVGPRLGEHTRAVLGALAGVDDERWAELLRRGIVAG